MVSSIESLRPFLKPNNLFVRDINRGCSPAVVRATLEKAGGPLCKVVIPLDFKTDQSTHIGQAYLNFATEAEAESCLDRIRFKLEFGKQRAKVLLAPGGSQSDKDRVWGPYSYKFQIIVKNLSEEVEVEAFYEFFSRFGEILQCKTDTDNYGQYYGQVQFMDVPSVSAAVDGANGTRWHGAVIQVVPHHKAAQAESVATPRRVTDVASTSNFPALGAASSSSAAAAGASSAPSRQQASHHQQQHQQQQQQQQAPVPPAAAAPQRPVPVNFAMQALDSSAGGSSSGGGVSGRVSLDSPVSRPLGMSSSSSGGLHINAPVVAPVAAPIGSHSMSPRPGTTGPGANSRAAVGRTGPVAASAVAAAGGGRMSLLERILLNRTDGSGPGSPVAAGMTAAAAAPAGPEGLMGGANGLLGQMQQPGTPNGLTAGGHMNGNRKKGGLIKSLTRALDQVSDLLCCPITHEVLVDPVVAADGITYERSAITHWLAAHDTSPMTNMRLANYELHPNSLVRTLIEELI